MKNSIQSVTFMAIVTLITSGNVAAQELEEIVVVAQKRTQNLQDVPAAIEVISGEKLDNSGISDLSELHNISPSYAINASGAGNQPYIRGVGSGINGNSVDSIVSLYVDGVFVPRSYALLTGIGEVNDFESVEILKGPQGTLYGRNATGGAIVIETFSPVVGEEFSGSATVSIGDYGQREFAVRFSGSLSDTLAATASYMDYENDGFVENIRAGDDFDSKDGWTASTKIVYEPTDSASFEFSAFVAEDDNRSFLVHQVGQTDNELANALLPGFGLNNAQVGYFGALTQLLPVAGVAPTNPAVIGAVLPQIAGIRFPGGAGDGNVENNRSGHQVGGRGALGIGAGPSMGENNTGQVSENTQLSLRATFNFNRFDLVSVSAYGDFDQSSTLDVFRALPETLPDLTVLAPLAANPAAALPLLTLFNQGNIGLSGSTDSDFRSQELYIASTQSAVEWIAGIYYFKEEFDAAGVTNDLFGLNVPSSFAAMETESLAVFGEATVPLTDALSTTLGIRYTDDQNDLTNRNAEVGLPVVGPRTRSNDNDEFTYTAKLTYIGKNATYYGGITTGYKAGIFNTGDPNSDPAEPEDITSYEVGFKASLADNRVRLNGAAFFYDYENIQLNVLDAIDGSTRVANESEAEVLGFELDIEALVGDRTTLFGAVTFLDSEYTEDALVVATGQIQQITGNVLPYSPDINLVAGLRYTIPLSFGELSLNLSANYNSGQFYDQSNLLGSGQDGDEDDSFTVAKASITYRSADDRWLLRGYVNNLTDEEYMAGGFDSGGLFQMTNQARPRHYAVTASYRF